MGNWQTGLILVFARVYGFIIVVSALALFLHVVGIAGWPLVLWIAFSVGVLYAGEAGHIGRLLEGASFDEESVRKDAARALIEVVLLLTSAFAFLIVASQKSPSPLGQHQITVRFGDNVEKAIAEYLGRSPGGTNPSPGPNETTVRFSPALEDALRAYLQKSPASSANAPTSRNFWILVLIAAGIAGTVIFLARGKHPEVTPLAIASGIALAIIYEAPVLPKPGGWQYWVAVWGVGLIGGGAIFFWRKLVPAPAPPGDSPQSPIVIGFCLLLLAGTLAYVAHGETVVPSQNQNSQVVSPSYEVISLGELTNFDPGKSDTRKERVQGWFASNPVVRTAKKGDILLLIGSTDCTPIEGGNGPLAENRAIWFRDRLRDPGSGIPVDLQIVPHASTREEGCDATPGVRGVLPFLLRSVPAN